MTHHLTIGTLLESEDSAPRGWQRREGAAALNRPLRESRAAE